MANNLAEVYKESAEKFGSLPAFFSKNEKKEYQPTNYRSPSKGQSRIYR